MRRASAAVIPAAILLAPRLAGACAVCFAGRSDEARVAFLGTTVLLTVLPLLMIGSLVCWLYRRSQHIQQERDTESALVAGIPRGSPLSHEPIANRNALLRVDLRRE